MTSLNSNDELGCGLPKVLFIVNAMLFPKELSTCVCRHGKRDKGFHDIIELLSNHQNFNSSKAESHAIQVGYRASSN